MKELKNFITESKTTTYGIGDHVKLSYHASKMHGQKYGQISAIGGYGDLKDHVKVSLKKSPLFDNDHTGTEVPIHVKELHNLSSDYHQHRVEISNHRYAEHKLKRGAEVKTRSGKKGTVESHNQINGKTLLKHANGTYSHVHADELTPVKLKS